MEFSAEKRLNAVLALLPPRIARAVGSADLDPAVEEIRLRSGRPSQVVTSSGDALIGPPLAPAEASSLLERLCGHSVYAMEEELKKGFIPLEGGWRVGVCGRPVTANGRIERLVAVSCFNFRIVREVKGCAERLMHMLTESGRPVSAMIVSPPGVGKTTLLRDISRCFSNGIGADPVKVAIADERGELAGCVGGIPTFDVGERTDVFELCPKAEAIPLLVRSMSPEVIITDEIGSYGDAEAVGEAARCGVAVIASAHASSFEELKRRAPLAEVLRTGAIRRLLLLSRSGGRLNVSRMTL